MKTTKIFKSLLLLGAACFVQGCELWESWLADPKYSEELKTEFCDKYPNNALCQSVDYSEAVAWRYPEDPYVNWLNPPDEDFTLDYAKMGKIYLDWISISFSEMEDYTREGTDTWDEWGGFGDLPERGELLNNRYDNLPTVLKSIGKEYKSTFAGDCDDCAVTAGDLLIKGGYVKREDLFIVTGELNGSGHVWLEVSYENGDTYIFDCSPKVRLKNETPEYVGYWKADYKSKKFREAI